MLTVEDVAALYRAYVLLKKGAGTSGNQRLRKVQMELRWVLEGLGVSLYIDPDIDEVQEVAAYEGWLWKPGDL